MVIAKIILKGIYISRCRLFRRIEDFNYEVKVYKSDNKLPFYIKKVIVKNEFEKSVAIKIENVVIKYSFDKLIKYLDVRDVEPTEQEFNDNVAIALAKNTIKSHNNATIIQMKDTDGKRTAQKSSL